MMAFIGGYGSLAHVGDESPSDLRQPGRPPAAQLLPDARLRTSAATPAHEQRTAALAQVTEMLPQM